MKEFFTSIWEMDPGSFAVLILIVIGVVILLYVAWIGIVLVLFGRAKKKINREAGDFLRRHMKP